MVDITDILDFIVSEAKQEKSKIKQEALFDIVQKLNEVYSADIKEEFPF